MKVSIYPDVPLPSGMRPAVTLGNFDGVHLGHQAIMEELKGRARARKAPSVAVTFEPHPISVLRPQSAPRRIHTAEQKQEILAGLGIDHLVVIPFTAEFSMMSPESFVRDVVVDKLRAAELVLGKDFRFGRERAGDLETLRAFGEVLDFAVRQVEGALYERELISSSRIRQTLAEGRADKAAAMLGRAYFVDGKVVKGDGRGRVIGFHTANLELSGSILVGDGVYVTTSRVMGQLHPGMSHIGSRPTFGVNSRAVETHLFDFSEDIYDHHLRLYFHERIRGTMAFAGVEELRRQLGADRDRVKEFFRDRGWKLVL
jgi:riboflavin kinase/FMN adenylyltransferase